MLSAETKKDFYYERILRTGNERNLFRKTD